MTLIEVEFPDEDAVFMLELLERMPGVRIRPPTTDAEAAEQQRIAEFRQRLYHSFGKDPLAEEGNEA